MTHKPPRIPLADAADAMLRDLPAALAAGLDGETLLGERAALAGFHIPGRVSAGGGCRLVDAADGTVALNLARPCDRELLPALFGTVALDTVDDEAIVAAIAREPAALLVARGRELGLAIAAVDEATPNPAPVGLMTAGERVRRTTDRPPRIVDLSALWAGPLAAQLLGLAGGAVTKVESASRPDAMRHGQPAFHVLLNAGKRVVRLDLREASGRARLHALVAGADIVIEAARPRALAQLGIDAGTLVRARPGLLWLTITAHGTLGEAANWVGFGDDVGVAAGLSAAMRAASGRSGFVGDAIADPLTGLYAARLGWRLWRAGAGGRFGIAMRGVAALCLRLEHRRDPDALGRRLAAWAAREGTPVPARRRSIAAERVAC